MTLPALQDRPDPETVTRLTLDYFAHLGEEKTAEDPEEWRYGLEEKFNALCDVFRSQFPPIEQVLGCNLSKEEELAHLQTYELSAGKMAVYCLLTWANLSTQALDLPPDERAARLAHFSAATENLPLEIDLTLAKLKLEFFPQG